LESNKKRNKKGVLGRDGMGRKRKRKRKRKGKRNKWLKERTNRLEWRRKRKGKEKKEVGCYLQKK